MSPARRAGYGEELLKRLSEDLSKRFGRGFSVDSLERMRRFYLLFPPDKFYAALPAEMNKAVQRKPTSGKSATPWRKSGTKSQILKSATSWRKLEFANISYDDLARVFPLPWKAYVRLLSVKNEHARSFYEAEALRSGWTIAQLDRQINSMFYERTALSKNKAAMLCKGAKKRHGDLLTPEQEIKDPFVLEFLGLKDEYSEHEFEEALIHHLEMFLLELGTDFAFIGRQKRLRIGSKWYRIDLLFFHRRLKCLVIVDLKLGEFTHADAGQMHLYLNYARKNWMNPDENPPVGLILCAEKDDVLARYALDDQPNKILAAQYKTMLPDEKLIAEEMEKTQKLLEKRQA